MSTKILLLISLLLLFTNSLAADCDELGESKPTFLPRQYSAGVVEEQIYAGSYALLVGGVNYHHFLPPLVAVKDELTDLAYALERQGFKVVRVCDPTAHGPAGLSAIEAFIRQYDAKENRLFIFLSGHGWVDEDRSGYFAAIDSPDPAVSRRGARDKGLSSENLINLTKNVKSRHLLVAVDACYSARMFTLKSAAAPTESFTGINFDRMKEPSRWFITAGSESEKTPSPSIFAPVLVLGISGFADTPPFDGVVSATELAIYVQHHVANSGVYPTRPRWGHIPTEAFSRPEGGGGEIVFRYDAEYKDSVRVGMKSQGLPSGVSFEAPVNLVAELMQSWPDSRYQVAYYEKEADGGIVIRALEGAKIPYLTAPNILPSLTRTNGLACHRDAPLSVVKAAARGLIEGGVNLRMIDQITRNKSKNFYLLQAIHFGRVSSDRYRNITIDDLEKLTGCPNEFGFEAGT